MGGGVRGIFGNTQGNREYDWRSVLDSVSNVLTGASLIPGLDTFTNLASIPVDLARGDFVSAGLSALGVIPVVGEIGDTAKLAKMADKAGDAAKTLNKASDEVLGGKNKWVSMSEWKKAITARKQGNATKKQIEMLNNGHWRDLK